jgi:phosphatidate cytidylyltransferase
VSNLSRRILTAVVAIPAIVAICIAGEIYFFLFIGIASALALHEFYRLAKAKGAHPQIVLGLVSGFLVNLSFFHAKLQSFVSGAFMNYGVAIPFPSQAQLLLIIFLLCTVTMSLTELFRNRGSPVLNLSTSFFGILYISLFFGAFIGLREAFTPADPAVFRYFLTTIGTADVDNVYRFGGYTVISIFSIIWICDSAAFHFGMALGKHKLFPRVSPNKSWEGAIFGFLFAIASAAAAKNLVLQYLSWGDAIVIGVIVGVFGQLGDLVESLFKRDAEVKDSSGLIPGHGGVFDRFDSLLLVAPLVYVYIDFIVL